MLLFNILPTKLLNIMGNSIPHSADVMDDSRKFLWNLDYLELMSKRWELSKKSLLLDVGCGIGHWGRMLSKYLNPDALLIGIDPETVWISRAKELANKDNLNAKYQLGDIHDIQYPDNHFDMVTCQTVLIHITNVGAAIHEMVRVLKPGGLLAIAEPMNTGFIFDSMTLTWPIDKIISAFKQRLLQINYRADKQQGDLLIASKLPGYLSDAGLYNINIFINDLANSMIPPYITAREKAFINNLINNEKKLDDSKVLQQESYLANGGTIEEFEKEWNLLKKRLSY